MKENNDLFEELSTDRLILRKIIDDDAKNLYDNIYNNFEYYKFYYQLPFNSFDEYAILVKKYATWYSNGNHYRWGIVEKNTNQMIGLVQLHSKDHLNKSCKLGFILGYNYNGKGYMNEALECLMKFAYTKLNYHRIEAEIVEENIKSINVVIRQGMKYEATKKESYLLNEKFYDQKVCVKINH